jgi:aminoglycoside phosphotransferase (APT) family kinase protein
LERIATRVEVIEHEALLDLPAEAFDLVYVGASGRMALETTEVCTSIVKSLTSGGQLFVEGRRSAQLAGALCDAGLNPVEMLWMTPAHGEMRSAVPLDDEPIREFFVRRGLTVPSMHRALRIFDRMLPITASRNRTGILARRAGSAGPSSARVPAYVRDLAAAGGVDLSSYRFGLSARGRYNSRKVVLYLFAPGDRQPELIVKATRDATQNERLENEERALRRVAELGLVEAGTAPAVVFSGEHGGLKILAETALQGEMLSSHADPSGISAAYAWLTELSVASARRDTNATAAAVSMLEGVESAVSRIYSLDRETRDRLRRATATLTDTADRLPTVFAHGDAATWNAMLRDDGRVAFLDWEAADVAGVPLWDHFYFARSHVLDQARLRRQARRPLTLIRRLLGDDDLAHAVESYCRRLDIPTGIVTPLFSLCWAHRALREVTRLRVEHLSKSHYLGLLKASLDANLSARWNQPPRTK